MEGHQTVNGAMNTNFERTTGDEQWLTPKWLIDRLGEFDLDPCSPLTRPWETAKRYYTRRDNGLMQPWEGRVWLNPPYGTQTERWLRKLHHHGNGIALIYARTDTKMFHRYVFDGADGFLFLRGRVQFCRVDGTRGKNGPGAGSCLIAYGEQNAAVLSQLTDLGYYLDSVHGAEDKCKVSA